jgi:hypothetical protein
MMLTTAWAFRSLLKLSHYAQIVTKVSTGKPQMSEAADLQIRIAVNRMATGKLPQGDSRWGTFNDSFVNQSIAPLDIANAIYTGHAYAGWHNGRRCTENFLLAQHIGIDMDSGDERSSFDVLRQNDFFRAYGGLLHTTPSHKPDAPRSRILFFLDTPIQDPTAFQAAAKFVVSLFPGADSVTTDASRFFYGAFNCDLEIPFHLLPIAHLRHYYAKAKAEQTRAAAPMRQYYAQREAPPQGETVATPPQGNIADVLLQRAISQATANGRNHTGLWLACQLRDNAYSKMDAERIIASYAASVGNTGTHPYTEQEALKTLHGAYSKPAREAWAVRH